MRSSAISAAVGQARGVLRALRSSAEGHPSFSDRSASSRDVPANTFEQFSLTGFGDAAPVENEQIFFSVVSGDLVIYRTVTDNKTNDSSSAFARRQ